MIGDADTSARGVMDDEPTTHVDLSRAEFDPEAATLLPEETARRYRAVPLERRDGVTLVALSHIPNPLTLDVLREAVGGDVMALIAAPDQVSSAIGRVYGGLTSKVGRRRRRRTSGDPEPDAVPEGVVESTRPVPGGAHGAGAARPAGDEELETRRAETLETALREVLEPPLRAEGPPLDERTFTTTAEPGAVGRGRDLEALSEMGAGGETVPGEPASASQNGAGELGDPRVSFGADERSYATVTEIRVEPSVPAPPPGYDEVAPDGLEGTDLQWPPLARVLVSSGRVPFHEMVEALRAHREAGESLARYLYAHKLATEEDLVRAMAEEVGLDFVDLTAIPVDPDVAALIPQAVARRHMVIAIDVDAGVPIVAMANPTDVFAMDDVRSIIGRNFVPVVATRSQIDMHLRQLQSPDTEVEQAAESAAGTVGSSSGFELESLQSVVEDAPIVRYVNLLILQALNERASDIHIEPTPKRLRIRFRIDGVMHDASSAAPSIHASVISRLKVLGEMDITEHRIAQEGRVSVSVGNRQIDLRLAIIPTLYGETCVMRLLDKTASIRRLSELGFLPDTLERYALAYAHPYGVILVTGPTGAGKTTTLYATLQEVMSSEKSVVTVEDPVEYQIDGVSQVQINPKVGLQFSTALRSILRADPDIILVGEIRDIETASIAMEAALSGHLVLSTLHTNTAASTPLRLTEMGIEPFLVTSSVTGVLTQRLARVLCERCKTPYDATPEDYYAAGYKESDLEGLDVSTLYRATGCRSCSNTGYHGRMLLAEVMPVTEEIERMIIGQDSIVAIERQAVEQGMRTLRHDGLRKALAGYTTLEEVLRVVI